MDYSVKLLWLWPSYTLHSFFLLFFIVNHFEIFFLERWEKINLAYFFFFFLPICFFCFPLPLFWILNLNFNKVNGLPCLSVFWPYLLVSLFKTLTEEMFTRRTINGFSTKNMSSTVWEGIQLWEGIIIFSMFLKHFTSFQCNWIIGFIHKKKNKKKHGDQKKKKSDEGLSHLVNLTFTQAHWQKKKTFNTSSLLFVHRRNTSCM